MKLLTKDEWDSQFEKLTHPHLLQSYEWGELKSQFGWTPFRLLVRDQIIQILIRHLPLGYSIAYIPKTNLELDNEELWGLIDQFCKTKNAIFLKYEPDKFLEDLEEIDKNQGFSIGKSIQPRRTIEISLEGDENSWLERMKSKTRYNIRLAVKKEIKIKLSDDVDTFFNLMMETSKRDKFGVHSESYYQKAFQLFSQNNNVALLLAYYEENPLAGLMIFKSGNR
ncbi:MAG TPA: peptidoglycan bridge formation glycyltransferase FemA/FemB family protein, partial [Anaerolineaceae bacterium]|nr:peptidoglycan bridge formation glycyltransferase FemA/FemB family protein [Anaerolineaceae bacterium]